MIVSNYLQFVGMVVKCYCGLFIKLFNPRKQKPMNLKALVKNDDFVLKRLWTHTRLDQLLLSLSVFFQLTMCFDFPSVDFAGI